MFLNDPPIVRLSLCNGVNLNQRKSVLHMLPVSKNYSL